MLNCFEQCLRVICLNSAGPVYNTVRLVFDCSSTAPPKKIMSYKLRNSDWSYVLPQCNSSVFKRSFINWCLFML